MREWANIDPVIAAGERVTLCCVLFVFVWVWQLLEFGGRFVLHCSPIAVCARAGSKISAFSTGSHCIRMYLTHVLLRSLSSRVRQAPGVPERPLCARQWAQY